MCRDTDCLHHRSYGLIRVVSPASCSRQSEGVFGWSLSLRPFSHSRTLAGGRSLLFSAQALKGASRVGPYSGQRLRRVMGQPLCRPAANAGVWGERGYGAGSTRYPETQQHCLASVAARLSSAGISHHNLLPHIPSLQSRAALALGLLHNPWGSAPLSGVCMASARTV